MTRKSQESMQHRIWPDEEHETFIRFWKFELEKLSSEQIIHWAVETYFPRLALSTSFGLGGCVLVAMLAKLAPRVPIIHIDTGYQHPETRKLHDVMKHRYGVNILYHQPESSVKEYEEKNGGPVYLKNPIRCCHDRKFQVFKRIARHYDAFICGFRCDHPHLKMKVPVLEWDERLGLVRISPLAQWSRHALWDKIHRDSIPYNLLFDQGFSKIDCVPCSSPLLPDKEDYH